MNAYEIQQYLNNAGFGPLVVDGKVGNKTVAALKAFQQKNGLAPSGRVDSPTASALMRYAVVEPVSTSIPGSLSWPYEKDMIAFYGPPGGPQATAGIVQLPIKFRIAWDKESLISSFRCHVKCVASFTGIYHDAVEHYGEKQFRDLGLDLFGGCYNFRKMRGGSAWSIHSWGAALDTDPENNGLYNKATPSIRKGEKLPAATLASPAHQPFWDIVAEYGGYSLGEKEDRDWMHFQFARR